MNERLRSILGRSGIAWQLLPHDEAFTAQEIAESARVSGHVLAKTLLVRAPRGRLLLAVVPAASRLDLEALAELAREDHLVLADEDDFASVCPDCEAGALPPIGAVAALPVYADRSFARGTEIAFEAGNHHEVIRVAWVDYEELVQPVLGDIARRWIDAPRFLEEPAAP